MITLTEILKTFEADLLKLSELLKLVTIQLLGWFFMFELTTELVGFARSSVVGMVSKAYNTARESSQAG